MVCSAEIRRDIAQILKFPSLPVGIATWSEPSYSCMYRLRVGRVVLSVEDSSRLASGRSYFDRLRGTLDPTRRLRGLAAFGLPAYESTDGKVVFLKDGKTLSVDTTRLASRTIPDQQSRADVAYAIAADVIGCWSE
ncbi:MAG: hypothetical protein ABJA86_11850 [Nocardioidaceae bacterium]